MITATTSSWIIAVAAILEIVKSLIAALVIRLGNLPRILEAPLIEVTTLVFFLRILRIVDLSPSL